MPCALLHPRREPAQRRLEAARLPTGLTGPGAGAGVRSVVTLLSVVHSLQAAFEEADADEDGALSFGEFVRSLVGRVEDGAANEHARNRERVVFDALSKSEGGAFTLLDTDHR